MSELNNTAEIVAEAAETIGEELTAEQLLQGENVPESAQETEQEESVAEDAEAPEEENKPSDDGRKAQYVTALREMVQYGGWTREEIAAMSKDETVLKDLAEGKSLWAAASAYRNRETPAQPKKAAKRAVPSVKKASADNRPDEGSISDKIARMSSKEFAQLSERAVAEAMSGKRVSIK